MFQVEPILWLQHVGGAPWRAAMEVVSLAGLSGAYAAALIVLAYVVRMRPALALVFVMLATAVVIEMCKQGVGWPRPEHVDARVVGTVAAVVDHGGADAPWALLPTPTTAATRAVPGLERGFPSGHVASATAFAIGIAIVMPWRGAWWFAALWIPAMAISRMSLGKHFLGDVLGGLVFGAAMAWLGSRIAVHVLRPRTKPAAPWPWLAVAVLALAAAPLGIGNTAKLLGNLAGVAIAVACLVRWPVEADQASPSLRWGRVVLAAGLYGAGTVLVGFARGRWGLLVDALLSAPPVGLALAVPIRVLRAVPNRDPIPR